MKRIQDISKLMVVIVPCETGNTIDQLSTVDEILECEDTQIIPLTDYFQMQNDEELPMHWSFLIDIEDKIDYTGCNIDGVHQNLVQEDDSYYVKYILRDQGIYVVRSHFEELDDKIRNEELHEYSIIHRESFIEELCRWIGECASDRAHDKQLMKQDLETLIQVEDEYILSSNSTNSYLWQGCAEFDTTCEELIEINNSL